MNIENDKVVSFTYTLQEANGDLLEASEQGIPMSYLHGHKNILLGLEKEPTGLSEGDQKKIILPPAEAYGFRRDNAEQRIPIKHLLGKPKRLQKGMLVKINGKDGTLNGRVLKVGKFNVDVDMNHPFAGKTLQFDVNINTVRDATTEEINHGHAHGIGGHQH